MQVSIVSTTASHTDVIPRTVTTLLELIQTRGTPLSSIFTSLARQRAGWLWAFQRQLTWYAVKQ